MTNAPIGVGIIGVHPDKGWAAAAHIPALKQLPQYRLAAISHNSPEVAKRVAREHEVSHAFTSADELVTHKDVDLVVITVKVTKHLDLVSKVIAAGKAVLCEWPLATNLEEAIAVQRAAAAKGVASFIGLQTRAAPPIAYARNLIQNGYVGEVLSATMIGSGILWGESIGQGFTYTLDRKNGAAMLNVPFAHSIDALLHMLGSKFERLTAIDSTRRKTVRVDETGLYLPMSVSDQVIVAGELTNGVTVATHFRGGLSQGTNFHIEINGTKGDIIVTSPVGYVGIGGFTLRGSQNGETLQALEVPEAYGTNRFSAGPSQSVALSYERLASDITTGTRLVPTFEDAVDLHRIVRSIEDGNFAVSPFK
jgi:predicted dehydrogenase